MVATTIVLGSNRFTGCRTLISLRQQSLLRIEMNPLRLSLTTPSKDASIRYIQVVDNVDQKQDTMPDPPVQVVVQEESVAIFKGDQVLASVFQTGQGAGNASIDLRPLGINVYTDVMGLHVGENTLSRNSFSDCDTAIDLG